MTPDTGVHGGGEGSTARSERERWRESSTARRDREREKRWRERVRKYTHGVAFTRAMNICVCHVRKGKIVVVMIFLGTAS
ncbi:hypothetical protein Hanom_Chr03g00219671 [Helianthus anomalus]